MSEIIQNHHEDIIYALVSIIIFLQLYVFFKNRIKIKSYKNSISEIGDLEIRSAFINHDDINHLSHNHILNNLDDYKEPSINTSVSGLDIMQSSLSEENDFRIDEYTEEEK